MAIPFDERELQVVGEEPSFFGPPNPVYNFPVSRAESLVSLYRDHNPIWVPLGTESNMLCPAINLDNVARAFVFESEPFDNAGKGGGPDIFGVEWVYVPTAGGSISVVGNPRFTDANDWKDVIKMPDVNDWDWAADAAEHPVETCKWWYFDASERTLRHGDAGVCDRQEQFGMLESPSARQEAVQEQVRRPREKRRGDGLVELRQVELGDGDAHSRRAADALRVLEVREDLRHLRVAVGVRRERPQSRHAHEHVNTALGAKPQDIFRHGASVGEKPHLRPLRRKVHQLKAPILQERLAAGK